MSVLPWWCRDAPWLSCTVWEDYRCSAFRVGICSTGEFWSLPFPSLLHEEVGMKCSPLHINIQHAMDMSRWPSRFLLLLCCTRAKPQCCGKTNWKCIISGSLGILGLFSQFVSFPAKRITKSSSTFEFGIKQLFTLISPFWQLMTLVDQRCQFYSCPFSIRMGNLVHSQLEKKALDEQSMLEFIYPGI